MAPTPAAHAADIDLPPLRGWGYFDLSSPGAHAPGYEYVAPPELLITSVIWFGGCLS
jgi:hypothetical protein